MKYSPVKDRLDLTLDQLKSLLGISGSSLDSILTIQLSAAKQMADNYMNNPFLAVKSDYLSEIKSGHGLYSRRPCLNVRKKFDDIYDTEEELPIPDQVKMGVIEHVRAYLHITQTPYSVRTEKEGDLTRNYRDLGTAEKYIQETYYKNYRVFWI